MVQDLGFGLKDSGFRDLGFRDLRCMGLKLWGWGLSNPGYSVLKGIGNPKGS